VRTALIKTRDNRHRFLMISEAELCCSFGPYSPIYATKLVSGGACGHMAYGEREGAGQGRGSMTTGLVSRSRANTVSVIGPSSNRPDIRMCHRVSLSSSSSFATR
jgi:hypothetical protein